VRWMNLRSNFRRGIERAPHAIRFAPLIPTSAGIERILALGPRFSRGRAMLDDLSAINDAAPGRGSWRSLSRRVVYTLPGGAGLPPERNGRRPGAPGSGSAGRPA